MLGLLGVLGSLDQPARGRLMMDPENPADSSNPHPFEIGLTGLLLEGWLVTSSQSLKDPSSSLATVASDTAGTIENVVRRSTVKILHS